MGRNGNGGVNSLLGQGSRYEGSARVEGTLRVDGLFHGGVEVGEALVIGRSGELVGDIQARDVVISGRLHGTIHAAGTVELQRGCRVEGDIRTRTLIVEEGVFFQGNCTMEEASADPVRAKGAETPDSRARRPAGILRTALGRRPAAVASPASNGGARASETAAASSEVVARQPS